MRRIVILCRCLHEILRNTGCDLPGVFGAVINHSLVVLSFSARPASVLT
jgi:hypothetical protein